MSSRAKRKSFALIGALLICVVVPQVRAATITVTTTNDSGPGSLRQALVDAHDGDTIAFAVSGTIALTSGGLPINKNVTISGPGADRLSIDGNQALPVFGVFPDKTAAISGLTIRNGQIGIWNEGTSTTVSNCVVSDNSLFGMFTGQGTLTASNCTVSGNLEGGLYNHHATLDVTNCWIIRNSYSGITNNQRIGPPPPVEPGDHRTAHRKSYAGPSSFGFSLTIANSTISDNSGTGVFTGGTAMVRNSTISGNSAADGYGGGISSGDFKTPSFLTILNSTISGNSASDSGGGIANSHWSLTIVNSTISGNSAENGGGGIANFQGEVQITNSTVSGNSAGSGGGIYNAAGQFGGTLEIGDTILNAGASGENIFNDDGIVTSHGYNLSSDDGGGFLTGPGDQINTDPLLGPLQDNGGPTLTQMPLPGSPAINAGDPNFTPPPFRDQRGPCFFRVFGRRIDIGSVETQPRPRCVTPAPRPTPH